MARVRLSDDELAEMWCERAAVLEYEGDTDRETAEREA